MEAGADESSARAALGDAAMRRFVEACRGVIYVPGKLSSTSSSDARVGCSALLLPAWWVLAPLWWLAGCGFHMQGRVELPRSLASAHIEASDQQSDFYSSLRRAACGRLSTVGSRRCRRAERGAGSGLRNGY